MNATPPLDSKARLAAAQKQLDLVLGFFGRADSKLSVVLGVDIAMLAVLFARASDAKSITWVAMTLAGIFAGLVGISFFKLFRGSFPNLEGGQNSLIYFREIGKLLESDFVSAYRQVGEDRLAEEYLEQAWRNSRILIEKFDSLKSAYVFMAWASLPWAAALAVLARA